MCCRKELKFGLCLEGTCNFALRGGGLISTFCSSQRCAINFSNSNFSKRLQLAPRKREKCTVLAEEDEKDGRVIKAFNWDLRVLAKAQLCYIPHAWSDQWICAVSVLY